ncbi:MAG TPA: hypothetical protein VK919_03735 [Solirubrobacterales bacterium]|nr:hypothetical protein [Solirubrobacterales bacterium]
MATTKQRQAARRNVKKAQAGARRKQTLKNLPRETKRDLGKEASKVRKGEAKTRRELNREAARLGIEGRSKMSKDELRRAVSRRR